MPQASTHPAQPPTRERILASAFDLFTRRGIELTTTREIAAAANCNEITLFRHFGTKDGLVREVIHWYVPTQETPQVNEALSNGDLHEDLYQFTRLMLQFHQERETFFKFIFANIIQHPEHRDFILQVQEPFLASLHAYFEPHLRGTPLDVATVVHDFITPIAMRTVGRVFLGQEQLDADTFARTHADLIAAGIHAYSRQESGA